MVVGIDVKVLTELQRLPEDVVVVDRLVRHLSLFAKILIKVDVFEPFVAEDLIDTLCAEPGRLVFNEQLAD